ncbi:MAG: hypothetical protein P1U56_19865 [Saprospiraceae bacterium]|nr:hypothetical protein [Saprospiraceae bacterium]
MRNLRIQIFFACMTLFALGCEKEEFKGDPGIPVFTLDVPFLNEDGLTVTAGDDLYYMFASHLKQDEYTTYSGLFGKEDICEEDCAENFAIKIIQKSNMESTLSEGTYEYFSIPKDGFKHNFSFVSDDVEALDWTTWRVGGEDHVGQASISFDSENDSAPQDGVELLYDVPGQFIAQFERPIFPKAVDCNLSLNVIREINDGIYLEVETESPFSFVSWSTGQTGNRIKVDFASQAYAANIFDASGCQTKVVVHFKTKSLVKDYSITLGQKSYVFSTPDNAERAVVIEYTDKEGVFYTSSLIGQILPFDFEIISVEEYEVNELGQPTWKIEAGFDCILFSELGSTKRIVGGKATFAVSY